ncbi:hypothetical protein ElyMa_005315000 [Elysia marginata]|uniref:Uncharacterized protein n=1 Tax=Elysia marginata TaxID=1093978 RepID=A0AAV4K076_9GAST|nr:hypothetical protein ElyMa_005315000 [Elysia marginata]
MQYENCGHVMGSCSRDLCSDLCGLVMEMTALDVISTKGYRESSVDRLTPTPTKAIPAHTPRCRSLPGGKLHFNNPSVVLVVYRVINLRIQF